MHHIYLTHFTQPETMKHTFEHRIGLTLLSRALSDLYNICIPADKLDATLETNQYGKPFLPGYPDIHFNISHGSDIAVCAIGDSPVGIDIEKLHDFTPAIFRKVFTEEERAFWEQMAVSEDAGKEWFFRFWTLKESRIKHAGMGLSMSLTDFSFSFDLTMDPYGVSCSDPGIFFYQRQIKEQYILSLCSSYPVDELKTIWI